MGFAEGDNYGWTTAFWSGLLWLAYEMTDNSIYREGGERNTSRILPIAFKMTSTSIPMTSVFSIHSPASHRICLTENNQAKESAIQAAKRLMTRFLDKPGVFQAWGKLDDPELRGNTIIDSLMNMPLLYRASEITGDERFKQAAHRHVCRLRDDVVRPNNTTFHTFYWNTETGEPCMAKLLRDILMSLAGHADRHGQFMVLH